LIPRIRRVSKHTTLLRLTTDDCPTARNSGGSFSHNLLENDYTGQSLPIFEAD
jgi:hypothetical protein